MTEYRQVPIGWLKPHGQNARVHSPEQIEKVARSIKEFGFNAPVVAGRNGELLAGHARVEAAKSLGLAEVPCVVVEHLDEAQRRAYVIADNQLANLGGWDFEMLHEEMGWLEDGEFDLSLTGFDKGPESDLPDQDSGPRKRRGSAYTAPDGFVDVVMSVPADKATAVKRWLANGEWTVSIGYGRGVMRRMGLLDSKAREGYEPPTDGEDLELADDLPDFLQTTGDDWDPVE